MLHSFFLTIVGNYCPLQKNILMELGLHLCLKDSQKVSEREHTTSPCATWLSNFSIDPINAVVKLPRPL